MTSKLRPSSVHTCDYCVDEDVTEMCDATSPYKPGMLCTRKKDHGGSHVACSFRNHPIAIWTRGEKIR